MNEHEKNNSIDYILSKGLVKPQSVWDRIFEMHRVLSLRFIFWDLSYSLIFTFITMLGVVFLFQHAPMNYQYSVALVFSPILFLTIMFFAEVKERACDLYELKQTFRYTSRQVAALRCIYYSLVGMVFAVIVTTFCTENTTQFFRLLPISLGGLFLCASIGLLVVRLSRGKGAIAIFSITWMCINLVLPFIFGDDLEMFLSNLPFAFIIAFTILAVAVFIYQTNKMLMEEKQYAIA